MSLILIPVITVDGPSGVGKGAVSQLVAAELGWNLLDSGVVYRLLALAARNHQINLENVQSLQVLAKNMDVQFLVQEKGLVSLIVAEGEDVTDTIRDEEISQIASKIAAYPEVRQALMDRQRAFKELPGLVADGRDMGTVVFPEAVLKIFLTASVEERAQRRYKQLKEKGMSVNLLHLQKEIASRDERDSKRAVSPLVPASDAIVIDTTKLTLAQVFERVMEEVQIRIP